MIQGVSPLTRNPPPKGNFSSTTRKGEKMKQIPASHPSYPSGEKVSLVISTERPMLTSKKLTEQVGFRGRQEY